MNSVNLMGRLTADPVVRYTTGATQMAVARYSLAIDRRRKSSNEEQREVDYINIVAFGKAGEFAEKYFHKGMRVAVHGRIQTGSYVNKNSGQKVYTFDVIVDDQEFADGKPNGSGASNAASKNDDGYVGSDGFMTIPDGVEDEGLPFN